MKIKSLLPKKFIIALSAIAMALCSLTSLSAYRTTTLVTNNFENSDFTFDPNLVTPRGLYLNNRGFLYVANHGSDLVTSYTVNGEVRSNFTVNVFSKPTGLIPNTTTNSFIIPETFLPANLIA